MAGGLEPGSPREITLRPWCTSASPRYGACPRRQPARAAMCAKVWSGWSLGHGEAVNLFLRQPLPRLWPAPPLAACDHAPAHHRTPQRPQPTSRARSVVSRPRPGPLLLPAGARQPGHRCASLTRLGAGSRWFASPQQAAPGAFLVWHHGGEHKESELHPKGSWRRLVRFPPGRRAAAGLG